MVTIQTFDKMGEGKTYTELFVAQRPAGNLSLPVVVLKGRQAGPTLTIVAGIHPTEYAGIEAALRFAHETDAADVNGTVIIVPFLNLAGFNSRTPGGSPEDMVDVWRVFPGNTVSSITYTVAHEFFQRVVRHSDALIDLHGGELNESAAVPLAWYPVTGHTETDEKSRALAEAFQPDYLVDASKIWMDDQPTTLPNGLLIHEAATNRIPSIIGEAGGAGRSSEAGADRLYAGLVNCCQSLGLLPGARPASKVPVLKDLTLLGVRVDGLLYCTATAGERVSKGQGLAEVRSWEGKVLQRISAPFDGIVTITVNWFPVRSGEYALAMARIA